jgi:four helix bundle protein
VHHVGIARGSLYELETLIEIAHLRGYLKPEVLTSLTTQTREVAAMLTRLRLRLKAP